MEQGAPADRLRNPAEVARVRALAATILAGYGRDIATARRASGYSNLTWLANGLALRMAAKPGPNDLVREARLSGMLPPEVGYPRVLAFGVREGYEWMLAEEAPGQNLGDAWPALGWEERARALGELWAKAEAVHRVSPELAARHVRPSSPFYAPTRAKAARQVEQLTRRGALTAAQSDVLLSALRRFWIALPGASVVLNHGDLCTENALWHNGHVSTLLDFEFAVLAPVELDANELVGAAYAPHEPPDALPDPAGVGLRRLREAATGAVLTVLTQPGARYRLLGHAILLQLWATLKWLAEDHGRENPGDWQPLRALTSLAAGDGGYLAPVLAQLGK